MRKTLYFALGFALALMVTGAVVLAFFQSISANDIPVSPTPTQGMPSPTPTGIEPTATPTTALPTPIVTRPSLAWRRDAGPAGDCATLSIDEQGVLRYGDCHGGTVVAYLSPDELATYLQYVSRYTSFQYSAQDGVGTLRLGARGTRVADGAEQQAIAAWAAGVYARLDEEEVRANRVAQTRLALAARLGISADAIETVLVEAVTWPDACLGITREGQVCAEVLTPGYRVRLDVAGTVYEYRTDRLGLVLADVTQAAPTQTSAPTASPVPTTQPTATALPTAQPTWTPAIAPTAWPTPYPFVAPDWLGEYYNNETLSGAPALVRNDVDVNFDWGNSGPGWGVSKDHFSARWSRKLSFEDGNYTFTLAADDGVRLWVAGNLLIDRWYGGERTTTVTQQIWKGQHQVVVEYFELEGSARARLSWQRQAPTPTPTLSPQDWIAEYYASRDLTGQPVIVRDEKQIAFDWWNGSPDSRIGEDRFSLRLTREVDLEPGLYRLWLSVDDGARVYVDDELVLDAWQQGAARQYKVKLMLKGEHTLRVEYFEEFGAATLHFTCEKVGEYDGQTDGPTGVARPVPTRTPRIRVWVSH